MDNTGDASAFGVVQVPFRITSSNFSFLKCSWLATFVCLMASFLFNGNTRNKPSWLVKVSWVLAALSLILKYEDFARSTFLARVDVLPLLALIVIGWVQGMLVSIFLGFARCIRSRKDAQEKGLPRIPDQVMRGMMGSLLFFVLLTLPSVLINIYWCRSPLITQLGVLLGSILLSAFFLFASVSDKRRLEFDNRKRILFDMVDYRIQLAQQSILYKDSPLFKLDKKSPSELQRALSKGLRSNLQYKIEWEYAGLATFRGESMLRFSYKENGDFRKMLVAEKVVRPYVMALSGNDHVSVGDAPKDVVEKAATYAVFDQVLKSKGKGLLWACINDLRREDLEAIIRAEKDVNHVYGAMGGWTVLMFAIAQGFTYGAELLLKAGANPDVRNANGVTPFLFAVRYDNLRCVQLLYDAGANIHETDGEGANALHVAAKSGAKSVVPFLIAHGVDVRQKDLHGRTALEYAQKTKCGEIAMMLRRKMSGNAAKKNSRSKRSRRRS